MKARDKVIKLFRVNDIKS